MTGDPGHPTSAAVRLFLSDDGSIEADRGARYAIRIAAGLEHRKISLIHVPGAISTPESIRLKIQALANECAAHDIQLHSEQVPLRRKVFRTLIEAIPAGSENYCICGDRISFLSHATPGGFTQPCSSFTCWPPGIRNLCLLRIMRVNPLLLRYLSRDHYRSIHRKGLTI